MVKQIYLLVGGIGIFVVLVLLFSVLVGVELCLLGDSDLDDVVGQVGISISVLFNFQENFLQMCCVGGCGVCLVIQLVGSGNNYLVIDDISGKFSFDEVILDVVIIKDGFGGDGVVFNCLVLCVGLKDISFQDLSFIIVGVNKVCGIDFGLVQINLVSVCIDGIFKLQGNVNIFIVVLC